MFTSQLNAPFDQKHELLSTNTFLRRLIASYARRQLQEYRGKFSSLQFLRKKKCAINFNAAVEIADAGSLYEPLT